MPAVTASLRMGRFCFSRSAPQGIGDERYEKYVERFHSQEELMENFRHSEFVMGAHKAFLLRAGRAES